MLAAELMPCPSRQYVIQLQCLAWQELTIDMLLSNKHSVTGRITLQVVWLLQEAPYSAAARS